jgi:osmotically-inducible protein OsmY
VSAHLKRTATDTSIRERLYAELKAQPWAPVGLITLVVRNGVAHLSSTLFDERHRAAIRVAAERIPGVKGIEDHSSRRRGRTPPDCGGMAAGAI